MAIIVVTKNGKIDKQTEWEFLRLLVAEQIQNTILSKQVGCVMWMSGYKGFLYLNPVTSKEIGEEMAMQVDGVYMEMEYFKNEIKQRLGLD